MTNINEAFPGKYLKADVLKEHRVTVVIDRLMFEEIGKPPEQKAVLYFRDRARGLVLNVINKNMLIEITGSEEIEEWPGKSVVLYPTTTEFEGKRVACIRIDHPAEQPQQAAPEPAAPAPVTPANPLTEDDIPF